MPTAPRDLAACVRWLVVGSGCLIAVGITGCRRPAETTQGISIDQQITPQPVHVGKAEVSVQLADPARRPVEHATVQVEADMAHPGMSPIFGLAQETSPGNYEAPIDFNMGGDWVLLLHIKLANGRKIEQQVDVRGVRSN